jgi:hypothetical protein
MQNITPTDTRTAAGNNFALRNRFFAFLNARADAESPISQTINPDIIGAAACMQGYVARLGLGMTLIKNQIVDAIPVMMNVNLKGILNRVRKFFNFSILPKLMFSDFFMI